MIPHDFDTWALYSYELPLHKPIAARGAASKTRKGFIVLYRNFWGIGYGEAAPIEGFHPIGWEQTREEILFGLLHSEKQNQLHAISRCAIEMAQHPFSTNGTVELNGLITQDSPIDSQFGCYKIKVGRQSVSADIAMMHAICAKIPFGTPIRLDANCAWSLDECQRFWKGISSLVAQIAYIEEPLREPMDYPNLEIPFALDERLSDFTHSYHQLPFLRAIILKPSLLGYHSCLEWMKLAQEHKLQAVISSTFESSIGLWGYVQLALSQPKTFAGLATGSWFAEDTLRERALPQNGTLKTPVSYTQNPSIRLQREK